MRLTLLVVGGKNADKHIDVWGEQFIIGRGEGCQLRPSSDLVSRQHCAIRIKQSRAFISDLDSANGTQVNGVRIRSDHELASGDQLQIGPLVFKVLIDASTPKRRAHAAEEQLTARHETKTPQSDSDNLIAEWLTPGNVNVPLAGTVEMKLDETHGELAAPIRSHSSRTNYGVQQATPTSVGTKRVPQQSEVEQSSEVKDASDAASEVIGNLRSTIDKKRRKNGPSGGR